MNALSTVTLLPASKQELKSFVQKAKDEILSGQYEPLEIAGQLKVMEELIKQLRDDKEIKSMMIDEAEKYPEKTIDFGNYTITKTGRTLKDYSVCGDELYESLVRDQENIKLQIKAREMILDAGFDPATGETFQEPIKKYTAILNVTLK